MRNCECSETITSHDAGKYSFVLALAGFGLLALAISGCDGLQTTYISKLFRHRSKRPFTYTSNQASIRVCCHIAWVYQYECAEDDSLTWGFAGARRVAGLLHSCRQRL